MRVFYFLGSLLLTGAVFFTFLIGIGPVPPMGRVLNPFDGVWRNGTRQWQAHETRRLLGLSRSVQVVRDGHRVPHIFAENTADLFFAQGYVMAEDRLFQMDLLTRVMLARVAEIAGAGALPMDRFFLSIGQRESVRRSMANMTAESRAIIEPFVAGVNGYIAGLSRAEWPPEYKLLGARPEPWTSERVYALLHYMVYNLAGRSLDVQLTQLARRLGFEAVDRLWPAQPRASGSRAAVQRAAQPLREMFMPRVDWAVSDIFRPMPGNGSNNWAVAASRSVTGHPIVANDTHLSLTLPAVWYENQLSAPGINVYGASLAGAPSVIVGFNARIAWAVTNAPLDVVDFLEVEFKDETRREYRIGSEWRLARRTSEALRVKGGGREVIEQVWTEWGPILRHEGRFGLAYRFVSHLGRDSLPVFARLNRAESYDACREAVGAYEAPAQNFICADAANIGLLQRGIVPGAPEDRRRFVLDGSRVENRWSESRRLGEESVVENPKEGFVLSANQAPEGGRGAGYLSYLFSPDYRAQRIREVLGGREKFSGDDMRALQTDELSVQARELLPILLADLSGFSPNAQETMMLSLLKAWDFRFDVKRPEPAFYSRWLGALESELWRGQIGTDQRESFPSLQRATELLVGDGQSEFDRRPLVAETFRATFAQMEKSFGPFAPDNPRWAYGVVRPTQLRHVARIPGWGRVLELGGDEHTPQANQGHHAATWRMVVELGPNLRAWTNYPGGQVGNPFDRDYDRFLEGWKRGELRPVRFATSVSELPAEETTVLVLESGGKARP